MIFLENNNTEPALNHAIEEYFLRDTDLEVFSLWQNKTCLLLGKNQDVYSEINLSFTKEHNIPIIRRLSGGGTVFCDLNNLQYTVITKREGESFEKFARPVIEFLKSQSLNAEFTGRNDILIDGKKISGNAQYKAGDRMIHHGTLLFDVDYELLKDSINNRPIKFSNKKVKSVISRVGLISDYLPGLSVKEFIQKLQEFVIKYYAITDVRVADCEITEKAKKYIGRFQDPDWNYGKDYRGVKVYSEKYDFGLVDYRILVKNGKITELALTGDYFESGDVREFCQRFTGVNADEAGIKNFLKDYDVSDYIKGMDNETFIEGIIKCLKVM